MVRVASLKENLKKTTKSYSHIPKFKRKTKQKSEKSNSLGTPKVTGTLSPPQDSNQQFPSVVLSDIINIEDDGNSRPLSARSVKRQATAPGRARRVSTPTPGSGHLNQTYRSTVSISPADVSPASPPRRMSMSRAKKVKEDPESKNVDDALDPRRKRISSFGFRERDEDKEKRNDEEDKTKKLKKTKKKKDKKEKEKDKEKS